MYKCKQCDKVIGPRVPQTKKVIQTKVVTHYDKVPKGYEGPTSRIDSERFKVTPDKSQIVKEISVCPKCASA